MERARARARERATPAPLLKQIIDVPVFGSMITSACQIHSANRSGNLEIKGMCLHVYACDVHNGVETVYAHM